jgi:hypothetical protein
LAKKRRCVYCGAIADTVDHVPPKSIFPKPRPSNLQTVPSCEKCNRGFQLNDDYFMQVLPSRQDVGDNPAALAVMDAAIRNLQRAEAGRFRRSFLDRISEVEVVTKAGIYVGHTLQQEIDYPRLESVARRTVRGLYHKWKGESLPTNSPITVYLDSGLAHLSDSALNAILNLVGKLQSEPPLVIDANVFKCWRKDVQDAEWASVWFLLFFNRIWFLCFTEPPPGQAT